MVILAARNIRKSLGGRPVLQDVSIVIDEGERVVILGANGSGKSTLLHVLSGVLEADAGEVCRPVGPLGFAPEKPDLPEHLLVGEWLDVVASLKGLRDTSLPLSLGIEELRSKRLTALSLGQRQRVSLATAWLGRPKLLVLDEPTNALDAVTREEVLDHLLETTVILATHDSELVQRIATRTLHICDGVLTS